jgi:hypothetical protein
MFSYLRFRWDSWRLQRQQRRVEKQNKLKIAAAKARGASADHVCETELEDAKDYSHFQDEIRQLTSKLIVPAMPLVLRRAQGHRPGDWEPDDYDVFDAGAMSGVSSASTLLSALRRSILSFCPSAHPSCAAPQGPDSHWDQISQRARRLAECPAS